MEFKKATKKQSKLRLAIEGASGSGKTFSSLILAKCLGDRIAVIDTEHGSASLYSDRFDFDVIELKPPYTPENYINLIKKAESSRYDVLIIDSISHEWIGEGGCLELADKLGGFPKGWLKMTPRHEKFINTILSCSMHAICTMRSKAAHEISNNDGKIKVEKKGTSPRQRDSIEYEFTTVFDLNQNHIANSSKDRTGLFDGKDFIIDEGIGKQLLDWLNTGEKVIATIDLLEEKLKSISEEEGKRVEEIINEILIKKNKNPTSKNIYELNQAQIQFLLKELKTY